MDENREIGRDLSVVMPVFNEESTLEQIARRVMRIASILELVIVDDHSTDRSEQIARSLAFIRPR